MGTRREIREGLAMLIDGTDGYLCAGAFATMEEAIARTYHNLPEDALVDTGLPGMDGIQGTYRSFESNSSEVNPGLFIAPPNPLSV